MTKEQVEEMRRRFEELRQTYQAGLFALGESTDVDTWNATVTARADMLSAFDAYRDAAIAYERLLGDVVRK